MHIALVTHYFEPDTGAAAVRLSRLAHKLHDRGHQITVLTTLPHYPIGHIREGYQGKLTHIEDRDGLRVIRSWLWATPSPKISRKFISQMSFMLTASLRGLGLKRPDVMLIEAQPVFTGLAGRWLSWVKRTPYVLNVSDLWPDHLLSVGALTETHPVYRVARYVVDSTYRSAAGIVAMSPAWAEKIAGYTGTDDNIEVIYNGVDLARFRPDVDTTAFRQQYHLGDAKLVTFIGTFATQYDFDVLLDAVAPLQHRDDLRVVLIGAGSQLAAVQARLTIQNLHHVRLIDWLDHDLIPQAWAASHLTAWAMRDEPLYQGTIPAKLYEALASGTPVATAMDGVGAEMIQNSSSGITVPSGNTTGLTDAITRLLDDVDFHRECSQAARSYAESHFDPDAVAARYEDVLLKASGK